MRIIKYNNEKFIDAEQYAGSEFETWYNTTVSYLQNVIQDESVKADMLMDNDKYLIQKTDGDTCIVLGHDKIYRKKKFPLSAVAFECPMVVTFLRENLLGIMPGIALRPGYDAHAFIHELLHALSSTTIHFFNENGISYIKIGTKVKYIDKNMEYVDGKNLSAEGFNEGITEALASLITGRFTGQYPSHTAIGTLFVTSNSLALNAYFSHDLSRLEEFYKDLEEKQSIITREDLMNFGKDTSEELIARIIAAGVAYNKAYNQDFDEQLYSLLIQNMDNADRLDNGSWRDLIAKYQTGIGSMS
ncbi:MAG: hypothetical protein IKZ96_02035 [Bacilli bacterium]|nr:hypothetical protein [Bacilli bacterium]